MQAICDDTSKIQNIYSLIMARFIAHDQTLFNNPSIKRKFKVGKLGIMLLLGDSGDGIIKYCIFPLLKTITNIEKSFNKSQIRARNPVKRCFRVCKVIQYFP